MARADSEQNKTTLSTSTSTSGEDLDLVALLKASQAISQEIVLDKLLARLLDVLIKNAGAQRGYLLLLRDGELSLAARQETQVASFTQLPPAWTR